MRRPSRHNEIELNFLKKGSLTYLFGGQRITIRRGRIGLFWAAIPHQVIGSKGGADYYVVTLPLAWFLQCRLPPNLVDRLLHGQFLRDPNRTRFELDLRLFQSWEKDLPARGIEPRPATLLEMHARLRRIADELEDDSGTSGRRGMSMVLGEGGISKVEEMAAYIARSYQQKLSIEDIAEQVKLHPNYAMNLFKQAFNITLNEYIAQNRISHAQRLLVTTDHQIVEIALDSGYQTLSRFYDVFRKSCGCSPGQYRKEHRLKQ